MSSCEGENFKVRIESFAESHYIKKFKKKYKNAWDITERAIFVELQRVDRIIGCTDYIETIKDSRHTQLLVKLYFTVAGTSKSKKSSGCRAIVFVDTVSRSCSILLVYSKNDIGPPNETGKWKNKIKKNFPGIWSKFE